MSRPKLSNLAREKRGSQPERDGLVRFYQWALENQEPERQLFLAVSQAIYIKHFQKPIF